MKQTRALTKPMLSTKLLRTIEGTLEEVIRPLLHQNIKFMATSRTDSGASANHQVVLMLAMTESNRKHVRLMNKPIQLRVYSSIEKENITSKVVGLNQFEIEIRKRLPSDIVLKSITVEKQGFNILGSSWKRYVYTIPSNKTPLEDMRRFHEFLERHAETNGFQKKAQLTHSDSLVSGFDIAAMKTAAAKFVGKHDFAAFCSGKRRKISAGTTVRTIFSCDVKVEDGSVIKIVMAGDGFLTHMCRIICGTLFYVGKGYLSPEDVVEIIAKRDRNKAGPTVWPQGLCLDHVEFPQEQNTIVY